jgi:hypothetical protein
LLLLYTPDEDKTIRHRRDSFRVRENNVSSSGLIDNSQQLNTSTVWNEPKPGSVFLDGPRATHVLIGKRAIHSHLGEILELRRRCHQEDDLTTEPEYFFAAQTVPNRRCAAVLIRKDQELKACVFFYEHTRYGIGLGLFRGGDYVGESLIVAPEALRVHYVHLATQALLKQWRIHGVSITMKAPVDGCIEIMGPASYFKRFVGSEVQHKLPLVSTYEGMLASMGPRTRRSLAGKRQQLEKSMNVQFIAALEPDQCLQAMLELHGKSMPQRVTEFYQARYGLLRGKSEFFSMGLRLTDGPWLSMVTGWRRNRVTYVDLQMNDMNYKKESLSAVMRAFLLEHEIGLEQEMINFVAGSSLLLRRYCEPLEPCTDLFISKPGLRSHFFEMVASRVQSGSVYERVKPGAQTKPGGETES